MPTKTNEEELGGLLGLVAQVLRAQVEDSVDFIDEETGESKTIYTATPATIAQALALLRDNDITIDPETDENTQSLAELIEQRRESAKTKTHLKAVGEDHG